MSISRVIPTNGNNSNGSVTNIQAPRAANGSDTTNGDTQFYADGDTQMFPDGLSDTDNNMCQVADEDGQLPPQLRDPTEALGAILNGYAAKFDVTSAKLHKLKQDAQELVHEYQCAIDAANNASRTAVDVVHQLQAAVQTIVTAHPTN
jgi:hypothetical protein